jgi:hypothetical protein
MKKLQARSQGDGRKLGLGKANGTEIRRRRRQEVIGARRAEQSAKVVQGINDPGGGRTLSRPTSAAPRMSNTWSEKR